LFSMQSRDALSQSEIAILPRAIDLQSQFWIRKRGKPSEQLLQDLGLCEVATLAVISEAIHLQ